MALLIATIRQVPCECCGSVEHSRRRESHAYCFHGQEWLLRDNNADRFDSMDGHAVEWEGPRLGWYLRGGRLPICPAHYQEGDAPMTWEQTG